MRKTTKRSTVKQKKNTHPSLSFSRIHDILENLEDGYYELDNQWRYTYINKMGERLAGRRKKEMLGKTVQELFPQALTLPFHQAAKKAMEQKEVAKVEAYYPEHQKWYENIFYPTTNGIALFSKDITKRKQTEDSLKASTEQLEITFKNAPHGITLFDNKGKLLFANAVAAKLAGYPSVSKMLAAKHIHAIRKQFLKVFTITEESGNPLTEELSPVIQALKGEATEITLNWYDKKKGETSWILARATPIFDEHKKVYRVVYSLTDITQQKQAEVMNKRAETIVETMSDPFITIDRKFRYTYVNTPAEKMLGRKRDELLGHYVYDVIPNAKESSFAKNAVKVLKTQKPLFAEEYSKILRKWVEVKYYPTAEGLSFYFADITHRKKIEENMIFLSKASKILSSSLEYQTTLNTVAKLAVPQLAEWCGIDLLDAQGNVQQLAIAHIDPKKVKWAKQLRKVNPPDMTAPTGLPNVLRTGKSELYPEITDAMLTAAARSPKQLELLRKLGMTSVMIVPLFARSKPVGAISFVTTSAQKPFSKQDLVMAEELASRASLAIENARLYTEAQRAIALRDEFISIASHELKTPVTSLRIYTQVLAQKAMKGVDGPQKYLNKMDMQIDKLTKLIQDLLDISKIQLGKLEFHDDEFEIVSVINEIVETLQPTLQKHTINISGKIKTHVHGDRDRISQILINLITNAIKYSPHADKVLINLSQSRNTITVSVQDFGIGIDSVHQKKIFERFYQVTDPNERTFPGLGIGLYIAKEIAKRHGGDINVKSSKGHGATFSLILPIKKAK